MVADKVGLGIPHKVDVLLPHFFGTGFGARKQAHICPSCVEEDLPVAGRSGTGYSCVKNQLTSRGIYEPPSIMTS